MTKLLEKIEERFYLLLTTKLRFLIDGISLDSLRLVAGIACIEWIVNSVFVPAFAPDDGGIPIFTALSMLAPTLLMFITVEELRRAENKLRYTLMLLTGAFLAGLFCFIVNLVLAPRYGAYTPRNFLYDLFYAVVIGLALESFVQHKKLSEKEKIIFPVLLFTVVLLSVLREGITNMIQAKLDSGLVASYRMDSVLHFLRASVFPISRMTLYPRAFFLLGALWYVFDSRTTRLWLLAAYALSGIPINTFEYSQNYWLQWMFCELPKQILGPRIEDMIQIFTLLAVPLILLYRHEHDTSPSRCLLSRSMVMQSIFPVVSCCGYMLFRGMQALGCF